MTLLGWHCKGCKSKVLALWMAMALLGLAAEGWKVKNLLGWPCEGYETKNL